ncbi:Fic family protein [Sulfitobacter porphyrae]|uniref:Fic family protein n=1 Tax=Sulfitobacter porphyrae TaxID=1246864 RepID=A0ABW2AZB1_9RHOB|nr:hypothetical protein GCM10007928_12940 [Sulfitobacter porphyrae]
MRAPAETSAGAFYLPAASYRLLRNDTSHMIYSDEALTYGGRDGVSSLHLIQSAISRPYSGYHRSIAAKASALLESVVGNHGFIDGNKRTAWILVELLIKTRVVVREDW